MRTQEERRTQILRPPATTFYLLHCDREKQSAKALSKIEKKNRYQVHARKFLRPKSSYRDHSTMTMSLPSTNGRGFHK